MIYIINCLLHGEVREYAAALQRELVELTQSPFLKEQSIAPHFTLKYWFDTDDTAKLEEFIREFAASRRPVPVKIGGFGDFDREFVYIDVRRSPEADELFKAFIENLKQFQWMAWDRYDGPDLHFHITIADHAREKFDAIMDFLKGKERYFDYLFDNITIYKLVGIEEGIECYAIHAIYPLGAGER